MWKEIPAFSFSAGERKIMAHFVVFLSSLTAPCLDINLRQGQRARILIQSTPWETHLFLLSSVIRYDKLRQVTLDKHQVT